MGWRKIVVESVSTRNKLHARRPELGVHVFFPERVSHENEITRVLPSLGSTLEMVEAASHRMLDRETQRQACSI